MAQLWKVRLPQSTVIRGLRGPYVPPPPSNLNLPQLQRHEWMALGALASGGLAIYTYILAARGRSVEAAAIGLLTAVSSTVTAVISHMNAPARAESEAQALRQIVHEGAYAAQHGPPPPPVEV